MYYILKGTRVIPTDAKTWAAWFEQATKDKARIIKQERVGKYFISTVFIGLDHNLFDQSHPHIFESMVFSGGESIDQDRYSTFGQALRGHQAIVRHYENLSS